MIPSNINRKNGYIEKKKIALESIENFPTLCYMDDRIYHKILLRKPLARQTFEEIKNGFLLNSKPKFGLTLKQKGIWNSSFGFYNSNLLHLHNIRYLAQVNK